MEVVTGTTSGGGGGEEGVEEYFEEGEVGLGEVGVGFGVVRNYDWLLFNAGLGFLVGVAQGMAEGCYDVMRRRYPDLSLPVL